MKLRKQDKIIRKQMSTFFFIYKNGSIYFFKPVRKCLYYDLRHQKKKT